ncbi:MAG: anthranilate phosphoribosyltransferase [Alphaproteobacteria bacterium]|nr:anthranilate phosphoribosyltransferase [Alphaproteobacteria bacterium]
MNEYLKRVQDGISLSEDQMIAAMNAIMEGAFCEIDLADFLLGLSARGETVEELTGAARVLRSKAKTIKAPYGVVDCCGTGGDNAGTVNISTAVALVVAACGVPVAKHGNRASSSRSGAADVLETLGVNLDLSVEALEEALEKFHFAFLMAPHHHPAMKHVMSVRRQLGVRTIFNLLGPLINPAGARRQLIGVFDKKWVLPMLQTLKNLNAKKAWVVHGEDGLDEISISGPTFVAMLEEEGQVLEKTLTPEDFGLPISPVDKLQGGDVNENALALRALLEGQKGAYHDIVLANAAAALVVHGSAADLKQGIKKATEALEQGMALQTLKDYIVFSRGAG